MCSIKNGVFENFTKFTGKHLRLVKFSRKSFLQNTFRWLPLAFRCNFTFVAFVAPLLLGKKMVVLFPEIGQVKVLLSPIRLHKSTTYENIVFVSKKHTHKQKNFQQQIYSYRTNLHFFPSKNKRQGFLFFNKENCCQSRFLSVNFI